MTDPIACRRLICVRPSGESLTLMISVGKPYSDSGRHRCPVSIDPLHERLCDMEGEDSWQALQLAMGLVERLLKLEVEEGSKLYWPRADDDGVDSDYEFKT